MSANNGRQRDEEGEFEDTKQMNNKQVLDKQKQMIRD
jgi:hypothetical protein